MPVTRGKGHLCPSPGPEGVWGKPFLCLFSLEWDLCASVVRKRLCARSSASCVPQEQRELCGPASWEPFRGAPGRGLLPPRSRPFTHATCALMLALPGCVPAEHHFSKAVDLYTEALQLHP